MSNSYSEIIDRIENNGETLKEQYKSAIKPFTSSNPISAPLNEITNLHQIATKFFNHYEAFVAKSDLFGVYRKELWAQHFYETCFNVLETIANHYDTINRLCQKYNISNNFKPSSFAYQAMQRVVFNFLKDKDEKSKVLDLMEHFKKLDLPIGGFKKMHFKNISKFEKILAFIMGLTFIAIVFITAIVYPNPTDYQYNIFKTILAFAAAGIGGILPGFISVESKIAAFSIRAGGALALGIVVYFFNPATL